jgi:hypothetical protein
MSRVIIRWLACGVGVLLAAIPLPAHHNLTAKFDPASTRTLSGVVTRLDWANPHVHILMDVVEGNTLRNWAVELESTIDLERSGWGLHTLKPGDEVTVQGMLARDGSAQIWGSSVALTASKRRVLAVSEAAKAAVLPVPNLPARPTPRWPDGKPRLGAPPGEKGYWGRPSATFLVEDGVTLEAMHIHKTGALIRAAVLLGAACGRGGDAALRERLDHYAKTVGLAFQVVDDILDAEAPSATLGKTAGKDARQGKPTYVSVMGLPRARELAQELRHNAHEALAPLGPGARRLRELADFIVLRKF